MIILKTRGFTRYEIFNCVNTNGYIHSKLQEAGFDLSKPITSHVNEESDTVIYTQEDEPSTDRIVFAQLGVEVASQNSVGNTETCVIEEMSELTKAICKNQRGRGDHQHTIEEISHVLLMCYALMTQYSIDESEVLAYAKKAVKKMYDENKTGGNI